MPTPGAYHNRPAPPPTALCRPARMGPLLRPESGQRGAAAGWTLGAKDMKVKKAKRVSKITKDTGTRLIVFIG